MEPGKTTLGTLAGWDITALSALALALIAAGIAQLSLKFDEAKPPKKTE